jgi:hypothetical protein
MKDIFDDINFSADNITPGRNSWGPDSEGYDHYVSMAEYEELRLLLSSAKAAFANEDEEILPDPAIHKNLRDMVSAKRNGAQGFKWPSFNFLKALNFPTPAYQFGLASIIILIAAVFIGRNGSARQDSNTLTVHKTDTIYEKVYKKVPVMALNDSESKVIKTSDADADYTDSIDYYNYGDSGANIAPGESGGYQNPGAPKIKDKIRQDDAGDSENRGGNIEDSSKGNRRWHGFM